MVAKTVQSRWLSILVPVYNVVPYLAECVASIMDQIDEDGVEVILLDDASTDGSCVLCSKLVEQYAPRLQWLVHPENRGLSAARNTMIEAASGEYMWFIDSDDFMLPGAIARLRQIITAHKADIILCDYRKQGEHCASFAGQGFQAVNDREALVRGLFTRRRMHVWTKISRRALWITGLKFPAGRAFEDVATMPWLFLRAQSYYYHAEPWLEYRVRSDSITGQISRSKGRFDTAKNDDLAKSLVGFREDLGAAIPELHDDTRYAIAYFCDKEYTKIGWRLLSRRLFRDPPAHLFAELRRYRAMMEVCSPWPFARVLREHIRRRYFVRWAVLAIFMGLSR